MTIIRMILTSRKNPKWFEKVELYPSEYETTLESQKQTKETKDVQ